MEIRRTETYDINEIAELHSKLFDKSHFTSTFPQHLLRKYFQFLIRDNDYCFTLTDDNNKIRGYIISGGNVDAALSMFLKENLFNITLQLLKNPNFISEKVLSFISGLFSNNKVNELLQIYIIAADGGSVRGTGKALLNYYEKVLLDRNIHEYGLSVRKNNSKAIAFYKKNGFIEISRSRYSLTYRKNLV
jgi:ribosomal protein S18 acetylase RimI-like enzyme